MEEDVKVLLNDFAEIVSAQITKNNLILNSTPENRL